MNSLIVIDDLKVKEVFVKNGLEPSLKLIKSKIDKEKVDVSTKEGRAAGLEFAKKIKAAENAIEKIGFDYAKEVKASGVTVDKERKRSRDTLTEWREEFIKPVTDWEEAAKKRSDSILARINAINPFLFGETINTGDRSTEDLNRLLKTAEDFVVDGSLEESQTLGQTTKDEVTLKLNGVIALQEKHEAEQAELEKLRVEAAALAQKEREDKIARDATEAAETRAKQDKIDADAKAAKAIADAEKATEAAKAKAIQVKADADAQAKQAVIDSENAVKLAAKNERDRLARIEADEKAKAAKREANKAHNKKINNGAAKAIRDKSMAYDTGEQVITVGQARLIVTAIAKGEIPNISITY